MKEKIENMDRRTFWILIALFYFIMFILKDTFFGNILYTISFLAFIFIILNFSYRLIRNSIELHLYKKRKKKEN